MNRFQVNIPAMDQRSLKTTALALQDILLDYNLY